MIRIIPLTLCFLAAPAFGAEPAPKPSKRLAPLIASRAVALGRVGKLIPGVGTITEIGSFLEGLGSTTDGPTTTRSVHAAKASKFVVMSASAAVEPSGVHTAFICGKVTARATYTCRSEFSVDLSRLTQDRIGFDREAKVLYVVVPSPRLGPIESDHVETTFEYQQGFWLTGGDHARAEAEARAKANFRRDDAAQALMGKRTEARYAAEKKLSTLFEKILRTGGAKDIRVQVIIDDQEDRP